MNRESLVKVYESQGIFAAEVVKAKLEASGIPALLKYESVGQIIGITVDGLGRVEVHVPSALEEEALTVISEDDEGSQDEALSGAGPANDAPEGEES